MNKIEILNSLNQRWNIKEFEEKNYLFCGQTKICLLDFSSDHSEELKEVLFFRILNDLNGPLKTCQAVSDGDCFHKQCSQLIDRKSHCVLPHWTDDPEY